MHAVCVEETNRAARDATASQTAARWLTSAAYATEAGLPRAPARGTRGYWLTARRTDADTWRAKMHGIYA